MAPGGGSAAALTVAFAARLVAMVARCSPGWPDARRRRRAGECDRRARGRARAHGRTRLGGRPRCAPRRGDDGTETTRVGTSRSSRSSRPPPLRRSRSPRSAPTRPSWLRSPASTESRRIARTPPQLRRSLPEARPRPRTSSRVNLGVRETTGASGSRSRASRLRTTIADAPARVAPMTDFSKSTDAELVGACRAGDADAWNELVERYSATSTRSPSAASA